LCFDADYDFDYSLYENNAVTNTNDKKNGIAASDLASLKALQPGALVDLQISTPTAPKRVKTFYVGMDYPRCMIFQIPNARKYGVTKDVLYNENTVIIRYVLEGASGQVIAFKAKVNHVQSIPSPLFFTTFPTALQTLGLRSEKRTSPGIAADFSLAGDKKEYKSLIVDVSQSGCRLAIDDSSLEELAADALMVDNEITVCVDLSDKTLLLKGTIRNAKSEGGYMYCGIQFQSNSQDVDVLLKRHIINV
jgi:c-di-GMP-binding flagellar brake protein YcgR